MCVVSRGPQWARCWCQLVSAFLPGPNDAFLTSPQAGPGLGVRLSLARTLSPCRSVAREVAFFSEGCLVSVGSEQKSELDDPQRQRQSKFRACWGFS